MDFKRSIARLDDRPKDADCDHLPPGSGSGTPNEPDFAGRRRTSRGVRARPRTRLATGIVHPAARYNRSMLMVEETHLPITITVPGITDDQFQELCDRYDNYRIEYTAEGELLIMPPTDPETGMRNTAITAQLWNWARRAAK